MPNIKSMEMGEAVSKHSCVSIEKSFLGIRQTAIYTPTQSLIDGKQYDFTAEAAPRLERILRADAAELEAEVKKGKLVKANIGNVRLELCLSRDHQFAAAQLFRYSDFQYRPVTDVRFFEHEDAQRVAALFE